MALHDGLLEGGTFPVPLTCVYGTGAPPTPPMPNCGRTRPPAATPAQVHRLRPRTRTAPPACMAAHATPATQLPTQPHLQRSPGRTARHTARPPRPAAAVGMSEYAIRSSHWSNEATCRAVQAKTRTRGTSTRWTLCKPPPHRSPTRCGRLTATAPSTSAPSRRGPHPCAPSRPLSAFGLWSQISRAVNVRTGKAVYLHHVYILSPPVWITPSQAELCRDLTCMAACRTSTRSARLAQRAQRRLRFAHACGLRSRHALALTHACRVRSRGAAVGSCAV